MKKFIGIVLVLCSLALPLAGCKEAISTVTCNTISELEDIPGQILSTPESAETEPEYNYIHFRYDNIWTVSALVNYEIVDNGQNIKFEINDALYCSPDTFSIERSVKECLEPIIGKKTKGIPDDQQLEAYKELCRYYYDTRMFGLVNTSYSNCSLLSRIKGACQVSMPMSYDPIEIIPMTITRCCVASDAERKGEDKGAKKGVSIDESDGRRKTA